MVGTLPCSCAVRDYQDNWAPGAGHGLRRKPEPFEGPVQVLTVVTLAGIFLPCLVTVLAIARELGWPFALRLMVRQAIAAALFCLTMARGGALLYS